MAILYQSEGIKPPAIKKRNVSAWIKRVAQSHGYEVGDIAYIFCDDKKILEINKQYLDHDYFTDIITFDYSENKTISGDIFISLETVSSNSQQFQTDYEKELRRVIIHGILHLCGINDKSEAESKYMTECENKALELYPEEINKSK